MDILFWAVVLFYVIVNFAAVVCSILRNKDNAVDKPKPIIVSVYDFK